MRWELDGVDGAVVVIDVIRAFTTAGCFPERPDDTGDDDQLTADLIERARTGRSLNAQETSRQLLDTVEASRTLALGAEHCNPLDIEFASQVDRFDFAMEVTIDEIGRRLEVR